MLEERKNKRREVIKSQAKACRFAFPRERIPMTELHHLESRFSSAHRPPGKPMLVARGRVHVLDEPLRRAGRARRPHDPRQLQRADRRRRHGTDARAGAVARRAPRPAPRQTSQEPTRSSPPADLRHGCASYWPSTPTTPTASHCLTRARENARSIRENISGEMWEELNTLYWAIRGDDARRASRNRRTISYQQIMTGSFLFQGLTNQTLAHGQGWLFAQLGQAPGAMRHDLPHHRDQVRHPLRRRGRAGRTAAEHPLDGGAAKLLLDRGISAACIPATWTRISVAAFLILERNFPRSISYSVRHAHEAAAGIRATVNPHASVTAERILARLHAQLENADPTEILRRRRSQRYLQRTPQDVGQAQRWRCRRRISPMIAIHTSRGTECSNAAEANTIENGRFVLRSEFVILHWYPCYIGIKTMLLRITHETNLTYSDLINETVMELRMCPRQEQDQHRLSLRAEHRPADDRQQLLRLARQHRPRVHHQLLPPRDPHRRHQRRGDRTAVSATPLHDPRHLAAPTAATTTPSTTTSNFGGPIVDSPAAAQLAALARTAARACRSARSAWRMLSLINEKFTYEKGVTTAASPITEILEHGRGVCQDFTHLMIGLARAIGIPARYVSGFVHPDSRTRPSAATPRPTPGANCYFPTSAGSVSTRPTTASSARTSSSSPSAATTPTSRRTAACTKATRLKRWQSPSTAKPCAPSPPTWPPSASRSLPVQTYGGWREISPEGLRLIEEMQQQQQQ